MFNFLLRFNADKNSIKNRTRDSNQFLNPEAMMVFTLFMNNSERITKKVCLLYVCYTGSSLLKILALSKAKLGTPRTDSQIFASLAI